jgi:DNA-directed RNA polymerase specialized sigma24 family protein
LNTSRSAPSSSSPNRHEHGWHGESGLVRSAVARTARGDTEAVHFLYVRHARDVFCGVRELVQDERVAEALTQSVFARVPAEIDKYEEAEEPFLSWVLALGQSAALAHLAQQPFTGNRRRAAI